MNRRQFAKRSFMATAIISTSSIPGLSDLLVPAKRGIKKGIMWGCINAGSSIIEKFQLAKGAGFDGVEVMSHLKRNEVIEARNTTGLKIPSVCGSKHWDSPLSHPDPAVREKGLDALKVTLEDAKTYGADTILLVPGRVTETVSYDQCWNRTVEAINKVVPMAEKLEIKIAIENVWNNFLLSPLEAASYIDQFRSPFIRFYFDCGNVVSYGWPEQWIKILGKRIAKIHIKEYSRKIAEKQGKSAGFNVKLQEGDVNWVAVMKALDEIGYGDWTTIEQEGGDSPAGLKELCDRLKNILES